MSYESADAFSRTGEGTDLDEMSDIGDVDSDLESSVVVLDNVEGVVQIASGLRIDSEDSLVAVISSNVLVEFSYAISSSQRQLRVQLRGGAHSQESRMEWEEDIA